MSNVQIFDIDSIDAVLEPYDWAVPARHAAEIEAYWTKAMSGGAELFNGKVLMQHRGAVEGDVFRAGYFITDYKSMLGYLRLGLPSPGVRNGFSMAALRSADGAFLLGEMGPQTANAGKIYFAAGTPDMEDLQGERVDLEGSIMREMCEETGLRADEVRVGTGWTCVLMEPRIAFLRDVRIDLPARQARELMLERMKTLHEQELSDIVIVEPGDFSQEHRMPEFMAAYLRHVGERG